MGFYYLFQTKTTCFGTDLVYIATRNDTLSQTKTTCFGHKIMTTLCENDYYYGICESICMSAIVIHCLHTRHRKPRNYLEFMKAKILPS